MVSASSTRGSAERSRKASTGSCSRYLKYAIAFLPQAIMATFLPSALRSFMIFSARRKMFELKPPARPRSETIATISVVFISSCSLVSSALQLPIRPILPSNSRIALANGVAASQRSVAWRIFAAATICMVCVTCFVDSTDLIRLSIS